MAVTATPIFPQAIVNSLGVLVNATGAFTFSATSPTSTTNLVSVVAAGTNGTIIESLTVSTTDTTANSLQLVLINGTTGGVLTTLTIAINSGNIVGTPPVDVFRTSQTPGLSFDVNGNRILYLPSGTTLYAGTLAAVTSGKQVTVFASGGNL